MVISSVEKKSAKAMKEVTALYSACNMLWGVVLIPNRGCHTGEKGHSITGQAVQKEWERSHNSKESMYQKKGRQNEGKSQQSPHFKNKT